MRFSGAGKENKEETGSVRDQSIPPQKTQSFKGGTSKLNENVSINTHIHTHMENDFLTGFINCVIIPTTLMSCRFQERTIHQCIL